jgi:hypothetical protein
VAQSPDTATLVSAIHQSTRNTDEATTGRVAFYGNLEFIRICRDG